MPLQPPKEKERVKNWKKSNTSKCQFFYVCIWPRLCHHWPPIFGFSSTMFPPFHIIIIVIIAWTLWLWFTQQQAINLIFMGSSSLLLVAWQLENETFIHISSLIIISHYTIFMVRCNIFGIKIKKKRKMIDKSEH